MSTPPQPCACTNISLMQLFHELKQKFPTVPDHVVSNTIELYCHDKAACETHLKSEVKASLAHAYHASSSAAAKQLHELKIIAPHRCKNQPIFNHEVQPATAVQTRLCELPQTASLSLSTDKTEEADTNDAKKEISLDKLTEATTVLDSEHNLTSNDKEYKEDNPTVTINIDSCEAKYHLDTPSEPDDDRTKLLGKVSPDRELGSTNYKILKSQKIKSHLHETLDKSTYNEAKTNSQPLVKEKNKIVTNKCNTTPNTEHLQTSALEAPSNSSPQVQSEKPKRPCTLEFAKVNPELKFNQAHQPILAASSSEPCRAISPAQRQDLSEPEPQTYWSDRGYPLNLSVNVNCHVDPYRSAFIDPWSDDFDSPRAYTSVNVTVCTPTSSMQSPVRDRDMEGHVMVTVSPSTSRAPRRRAPPPPPQMASLGAAATGSEPTGESLVARQKARMARLARELQRERDRLRQLERETAILAAPPPSGGALQRLRDDVARLRLSCDTMTRRLDRVAVQEQGRAVPEGVSVHQRRPVRPAPAPPAESPWQCHVCTFHNHPLLNKCEECDMPRILLVRAGEEITVRLVPGRRKIVHSWIL